LSKKLTKDFLFFQQHYGIVLRKNPYINILQSLFE